MKITPGQINLMLAWLWILLGFVSGIVLGMFFHCEDRPGGYANLEQLEPEFVRRSTRIGKNILRSWRLSQKDVALSHKNEKDHVGDTKQRHEDQVRHVSDERIIKNGGAVRQLVQHADENQIEILPQIAARNEIIGHPNHKYERAQKRNITAVLRQFVAYPQRPESSRLEKCEHDSQNDVIQRGDQKQTAIILLPGRTHAVDF
jgi:hypothetical protein